MPYIKVNINSILSYGDLFNSVKNRSIEIRNRFVSLVNDLEWDVKSSDGIYDSAKSIVSELETESNSLNKMTAFAAKASQVYGLMDYTTVPANVYTGTVTTTCFKLTTQDNNSNSSVPDLENRWYTDMFSNTIDILGKDCMKEFSDKIVGLGYVSSVFGFNDLILDTYENAKNQVEWTNAIQNDSRLTDEEKAYMLDKVGCLTNVEATFDAAGWGVGVFSGMAGKIISHIGDAINSEGVYEELLEGYREVEDARKKLDDADTFGERFTASLSLGWEQVERAYEVSQEVVKEYLNDVVKDTVEIVDKAVVQPLKKVGEGIVNGIKKLFSW